MGRYNDFRCKFVAYVIMCGRWRRCQCLAGHDGRHTYDNVPGYVYGGHYAP